jgi:hypothetical protein
MKYIPKYHFLHPTLQVVGWASPDSEWVLTHPKKVEHLNMKEKVSSVYERLEQIVSILLRVIVFLSFDC